MMAQLGMAAMANLALANEAVVTAHFQLLAMFERKPTNELLMS